MAAPTPLEFMEKVVAWPGPNEPGYVNLHWMSPNAPGMRGRPFRHIKEFMSFVEWGVRKPSVMSDIYFCLSTQEKSGKTYGGKVAAARSAHDALKLKAVWLDVDVKAGKGYARLEDGIVALTAFCAERKLPSPSAVVLSGGGMHVYWISNVPLNRAEWECYATSLREAAMRGALKCDYGVTTDAARVLRVPGSFNYKTTPPKVVRLAAMGQTYDFAVAFSDLIRAYPAQTEHRLTSQKFPYDSTLFPKRPIPPEGIESLSEGINTYEDTLLDPKGIFKFCPHFEYVYKTKGKDCSQGLWMLDVLSTTFMEEGNVLSHFISKGHKGYTKEATDAMYGRKLVDRAEKKLGWPTCSAFENEGSTQCATCVYRGKIKSPLNLAERTKKDVTSFGVNAAPSTNVLLPGSGCSLPDGYTLNEKGWISKLTQKRVGGVYVDEPQLLFMSKLRDFWCQGGRGTRSVRFTTSLDGDNTDDVVLWEHELGHPQILQDRLRKQGVKPCPPNKHMIEEFLTSFMAKYDEEKKRIDTLPFGWMRTGEKEILQGFVYGGKYFQRDGTISRAGYSEENLEQFYRPKGTIEPWIELCKIVTARQHPALEALVATSFAAPLMFVPAVYNGVFIGYSHGGGRGKSTSLALALGVWANPKMAKENTQSSMVGVMKKMGHLRNIPIVWDEIDDDEKMDVIVKALQSTEGKGGTKLYSNRDFRDPEQWQTMITIGANVSLWQNILKKSRSSDSKLERVFELEVDQRPDNADPTDVHRLTESLDRNYGQMGLRYAEFLGKAPDEVFKVGDVVLRDFRVDVCNQSKERFRSAMAAMTITGAILANKMGATFNIDSIYTYIKQQFLRQRDEINKLNVVGGSLENTAVLLSEFFKAHLKNTYIAEALPRAGKGRKALVRISGPDPLRGDPIHIFGAQHDRAIRISRSCLTKYIEVGGKFSVTGVINGLVKHFNAKLNLGEVNLAAGTGFNQMRELIIELPVPDNSPLMDILFGETGDRPSANGSNGHSPVPPNGNGAAHTGNGATQSDLVEKIATQAKSEAEFVRDRLASLDDPD